MRHVVHTSRGLCFLTGYISSLNIFIWAIALCCHAGCQNFAALFVVRFILGMCEGSMTAGFLIVSSMFYTREEQTARVGYWCECCDDWLSVIPISLSNSYDEWNWFECRICSASQTLIEVAAQIISGFISFGALHIHTAGFQPWQWLDQD